MAPLGVITTTATSLSPPAKGTGWPLNVTSTAPALPVQKTTCSLARMVFTSGGPMMPRTVILPSVLIDTHALSLGRTVTSIGWAFWTVAFAVLDVGLDTAEVASAVLVVRVPDGAAFGLDAEFRSAVGFAPCPLVAGTGPAVPLAEGCGLCVEPG